MPPDSTLIQETAFFADFDLKTLISLLGLLVSIITLVFFRLKPQFTAKKKQKHIEASFGGELFPKEVIERATQYYVEPDSMSVDPGGVTEEMRKVVGTRENLAASVDRYLKSGDDRRHLLLLADSGMGKTAFVLNYYARNQALSAKKRKRIAIVPLGIPDADERIKAIDDKRETILFLDAFDEDTLAIVDHKQRIVDLMSLCRDFHRVLITCRTQFFPSDEEITRDTGIVKVTPRSAGERNTYEFWKLYLAPLTDDQVDTYLNKRYTFFQRQTRKKAKNLVAKVPMLSVRPMLLTHIPDLIAEEREIRFSTDMYEVMIEAWLEREHRWVDPAQLRPLSEKLALDLYLNAAERRAEIISLDKLERLAREWSIDLENWQLTGRSLLNRDAIGNYKFSHRSIMEYLFVRQILDKPEQLLDITLTELMKGFFLELLGVDPIAFRNTPQYKDASNARSLVLGFLKHIVTLKTPHANKDKIVSLCFPLPEMVEIPAGSFIMGSTREQVDALIKDGLKKVWVEPELDQHRVNLGAYEIGKYPVSNIEYQQFVDEAGYTVPSHWEGGRFQRDKGDHPVVGVSWEDAQAYCAWLSSITSKHYALPKEAQWEKAARGDKGNIYPWGNSWDINKLNSFNGGRKDTSPVGAYTQVGGDSPYGCADMAGNVWEWCLDGFDAEAYKDRQDGVTDPYVPFEGRTSRVLRGGAFSYDRQGCRCAFRNYNNPSRRGDSVGFRIVLLP